MKFLIQISRDASVSVDGVVIGKIDHGMTVLCGVGVDDDRAVADRMIRKLLGLRIFPDENGKTNLNISQVGGSILLVSQFTLYADISHGNRPGFTLAGPPALANELYEYVIESIRKNGITVETGSFGADMQVSLTNMGPFTIMMDSAEI